MELNDWNNRPLLAVVISTFIQTLHTTRAKCMTKGSTFRNSKKKMYPVKERATQTWKEKQRLLFRAPGRLLSRWCSWSEGLLC